jgi:hypothetical protein
MKVFLGLVLVALGLAIAIIPQYMTCQHQGKYMTLANGIHRPMNCSWTARSEIAVGVPLAGIGVLMTVSRRKESLRNLALIGVILGVFVILLPTDLLIGVCRSNMLCHTAMKPLLAVLGTLAIGTCLVGLLISQTVKEKE